MDNLINENPHSRIVPFRSIRKSKVDHFDLATAEHELGKALGHLSNVRRMLDEDVREFKPVVQPSWNDFVAASQLEPTCTAEIRTAGSVKAYRVTLSQKDQVIAEFMLRKNLRSSLLKKINLPPGERLPWNQIENGDTWIGEPRLSEDYKEKLRISRAKALEAEKEKLLSSLPNLSFHPADDSHIHKLMDDYGEYYAVSKVRVRKDSLKMVSRRDRGVLEFKRSLINGQVSLEVLMLDYHFSGKSIWTNVVLPPEQARYMVNWIRLGTMVELREKTRSKPEVREELLKTISKDGWFPQGYSRVSMKKLRVSNEGTLTLVKANSAGVPTIGFHIDCRYFCLSWPQLEQFIGWIETGDWK